MSFIGTYDMLPPSFVSTQPLPPLQEPMATLAQMREHDKLKRRNTALIIALVIIIILLVAAVIAVFVLLFTDVLSGTTGTTSPTSNTLTVQMKFIRTDVTFSSAFADSSQNAYQGLLSTACGVMDGIATTKGFSQSDCTAGTMSAVAAGVQIDALKVVMSVGTQTVDDAFIKLKAAIISTVQYPFAVTADDIVKV